MYLNNKKGIALVAALALLLVASGVIVLIFSSTLREMNHSKDDINITRTLLLVRGTSKMSDNFFQASVRNKLRDIVNNEADMVSTWQFGDGPINGEPSPETVITDLLPVANQLQVQIDNLLCNANLNPIGINSTVSLRIFVTDTACGQALPSSIKLPMPRFVSGAGRTYALPYVVVSEASNNEYKRNLVIQGEYRFAMNGDRFSKYGMFTHASQTKDGDPVWFTDDTLMEGPVHTNEYFRFFKEPWFGGQVTSAGYEGNSNWANKQGGLFYSQGFVTSDNLDQSPSFSWPSDPNTVDEPAFTNGVDWEADKVELPTTANTQKQQAQANGLYINSDLYSLKTWAADNAGNALASDGNGGWQPSSSYQYIETCTAVNNCTQYRYASDEELYVNNNGNWDLVEANFNGVVFVDGETTRLIGPNRSNLADIDSAPPAIASFAQLNIVSQNKIRISSDIKYEDLPCTGFPTKDANGNVTASVCNNLNAQNILGIYSVSSDIVIGNNNADPSKNAPSDVVINGSLMSGMGVVEVENFKFGAVKGNVRLLGGIIQKYYGGFGTFDSGSGTALSGFGRQISYDQRFGLGMAPPVFPGANSSKILGVFVLKYGQSEQVY
ncbi:MAG TPA: DUF4900 domain-containing protein [Trueperaceae bacterium]|nr:DUF4900 domain-containing protein [Trueperaceae bacterium]